MNWIYSVYVIDIGKDLVANIGELELLRLYDRHWSRAGGQYYSTIQYKNKKTEKIFPYVTTQNFTCTFQHDIVKSKRMCPSIGRAFAKLKVAISKWQNKNFKQRVRRAYFGKIIFDK